MIDEQLFKDLRQYILAKTGKYYFNNIKRTTKDLMISCPFHKQGQERKPSCGVKLYSDEFGSAGTVHCFTCGTTTNISLMVQQILGTLYDREEVNNKFHLDILTTQSDIVQQESVPVFVIPKNNFVSESVLRQYRNIYHPYLQQRGIIQDVAKLYDIGFDKFNQQITFPIRDINRNCLAVGRRSILQKKYIYPPGFVKPLYGLYELDKFLRYVYIVEGPFNLWSLKGWKKQGVALLGTGTSYQYKQLLNINCSGFVLALDGDNAGRNGTKKLINFLTENNVFNVFVALIPDNKDINDLTFEEFRQISVVSYKEWLYMYSI